jgi:hypothetical protein
MPVIKDVHDSKVFYQGVNVLGNRCHCSKCKYSSSRHLSNIALANPGHTYWDYLEFCIMNVTIEGLWLEFGVYKGATIQYLARRTSYSVFGFDSFWGLPENWVLGQDSVHGKGTYTLNGIPPDLSADNIELILGNYQDVLPRFLKLHTEPCAFLHMDSDLYTSTKYVLDSLFAYHRIVTGSVILFDEFYNYPAYEEGEYKAFIETQRQYSFRYRWLAHTESVSTENGNGQQAALVVM